MWVGQGLHKFELELETRAIRGPYVVDGYWQRFQCSDFRSHPEQTYHSKRSRAKGEAPHFLNMHPTSPRNSRGL
jgi:hypothetical protein